jgi:large subunit ribosomal protein L13
MTTKFLSTVEAREGAKWWVIDAAAVPVGRVATEAANLIRGKHKATFTPSQECGDFVVVVNADKVVLTGGKGESKMYRHHTGFAGGLKEIPGAKMLAAKPDVAITRAVAGMVPSGVLGHRIMNKLKVYTGSEHPHAAQMPKAYAIKKPALKKGAAATK